ncbi:4-hydroxythreonine-4-phosphate dehydrogenase PdxA [Legionella micdadei]|uniref:4-hydroxythreonine-4-phosphate dehydrogenase n=1 Tax=Legionella micdadei TaxID=451 RepID=A0A098GJB8_LEGMI|nr:4-hydroxythreonine-4-phosphate dehydrogenase PdxA [Legionella micdadei]ARG98541.1 4-hydroxythreonine-4-phosphate dehydrogenase PdxA [Legionella micdadei]ARH01285.1 4-hydroxythreonine-4-phosphate dehydrogenase PdxA [Legionella micdadei]KTD27400.1 4-hydroxythreonine-4-phosphate dehydrogenase [Legionella micdadei]NSL19390.1 4-hydroxythreonine-4-phosphate dehydrogenase PdxA [Legionella micdadei]CEG62107.1 4-hydroxythreonine-4-phosphate dehydrogenase [Legionella micdadei]
MKPLLISSGEPAGIGPDLCLGLASCEFPLVVLGDKNLIAQRAKELKQKITIIDYQANVPVQPISNCLTVLSIPCAAPVVAGKLNPLNAPYVVKMLSLATDKCLQGEFSALVTAPVHKAVINQAGMTFTGHTEFLAERCKAKTVVMLLACGVMKVALVTTHLPLREVADAITSQLICDVIEQLHSSLQQEFAIANPQIYVAGLNPHAGEGGYLGREEIEVISPALKQLKEKAIKVHGPFPADTMFTPKNLKHASAFVAMYHDQGLPVLKYAGFGSAVNITLGLPIIRTSVDHGTALELAGTGLADTGSMLAAVNMANSMAKAREYK